ncbi:MAG: DoxX family protein [Actinomycetota bacterium]|nr:DoxX family protein [Actinomycetota bacterium]
MDNFDIALLILRLWAGLVFIAHGLNHGRSLEGTANWFESVGFRQPRLNAFLSSANEIAIGTALIFGILTSVAAAGLAATMFVAFWSIHRFAGFFNFHRPDEGYEYVATLAVIALALTIAGPGSASLDSALGIAENLDGWVGAGIFGLGILAAVGQLATFWRKPEKEETTA